MIILLFFLCVVQISTVAGGPVDKEFITRLACKRNPSLEFCFVKPEEIMVTPPPLPQIIPNRDESKISRKHELDRQAQIELEEMDRVREKSRPKKVQRYLTQEEATILRAKCTRMAPTFQENCSPSSTSETNRPRCEAYVRDCYRFMTKGDPLAAIANSFSSAVNVNVATVEVNGIPYYPVNEEGGIGVSTGLSAPFGSWGGGYSDHVGVRDYWSQHQEVGANWYDGKYGYKNGWSVPLVQSLGVEGGQHNTVSVPLHGPNAGRIDVDNGYNVGGYYGHNDHVGVDWKKGDVGHTFGVGSPFVGTGFMTGQAVSFPGPDVWERALGRK